MINDETFSLKVTGQKLLLQVLVVVFAILFIGVWGKLSEHPMPSALSLAALLGAFAGYGIFFGIMRGIGIDSPYTDFTHRASKITMGGMALALLLVLGLFLFESRGQTRAAESRKQQNALQQQLNAASRANANTVADLDKMLEARRQAKASGKGAAPATQP
jgi:hypothetical protein